ncbi:hypothetical protein BSN85_08695 [Bradyrhizobium brasilense]|uniref:IS66 family insertion sequence element accessory protein TnpB n=1 Tax=Bradyrhizobium brasilense TaxID=1419277 RepID=UPI0009766773|nr:IS66 family insertion sequence element accessory protein TnpB [Bradyrhizobium brasilense]OMI12940.1 hypothetical protein BSN85_08695 [Bradyrhizobium brasilense]
MASHPVDFRKGIDGLVALVRDAGSNPFDGALYVFRAKRADRIKLAWWDGGQTWATIATLLQAAKMNNVDPFAWLPLTLQRIANGWPSSEIDALMPCNHAA